jgi:hypothetical protein
MQTLIWINVFDLFPGEIEGVTGVEHAAAKRSLSGRRR